MNKQNECYRDPNGSKIGKRHNKHLKEILKFLRKSDMSENLRKND